MRILLAEDERTLALRGERDFRAEPVGRGLYADPTMLATQIRRIAAALLAATGILHLALAPEYLHQKTYVGLLFIAGGLTSAAAAAWLWARHDMTAWVLGGLTAAGMAAGFVVSRLAGLRRPAVRA